MTATNIDVKDLRTQLLLLHETASPFTKALDRNGLSAEDKLQGCVSEPILDQCSPKSATGLAYAFSIPEISSCIINKAELDIILYDSALARSEPVDVLRYVGKWTGAHVYKQPDTP